MKTKLNKNFIKAKNFLSDSKNWIKGSYAEDSLGYPCSAFSKDAKCFCILGSFLKFNVDQLVCQQFRDYIFNEYNQKYENLSSFNDNVSHAELIQKMEQFIEKSND